MNFARILLVVSLALGVGLAACAQIKAANENGGTVSAFHDSDGLKLADEHCAKYGKTAKITGTKANDDYTLIFECVSKP
jgi:hypothetical protein